MFDEVEKNLFRIRVQSRFPILKPPVNLYLFAGEDGLLWDAGYGGRADIRSVAGDLQRIASRMEARGDLCRITRILISHGHGDHFAGLSALRRITQARVLLTGKTAARIASRAAYRKSWEENPNMLRPHAPALVRMLLPLLEWIQDHLFGMQWMPDPDMEIPESGTLRAGGRILHYFPIPGHADDHLALYCPSEGLLMSGDHVLRTITPWLGPPRASIEAYEESLKRLAELPFLRRIFPAHGSPIEDPSKRLLAALEHSQRRTQRVLEIVSHAGPCGISFPRLLSRLYPLASPITRISAEGWVVLTLRMLMKKEKVRAKKKGGKWRFRV